MAFSDILCPMISLDADEPVLTAAAIVATFTDARITALMIDVESDPTDARAPLRPSFEAQKHKLQAHALGSGLEVRELTLGARNAGERLATEARQADLTIMLRPGAAPMEDLRMAMAEGVLFGSGRPL